ncbi:protein stoned-A [Nilaparvata lugens]|uniref:protein stoned-A n=1 Tax=Nilaparvata lugens TaxID=108931 RepID=UPI00193E7DCF|nr:protein stoned-A [Nilaparvata lugens]
MLKITKGLKKKKKGKKGKHKEEERFEAELEEYRKEQERKKKQQEEEGEGTSAQEGGEEAEKKEKGEEWEKFKALTSGVDNILKKTQDDLDRIKSQSFFQKKPTAVEQEAAEKAEREAAEAAARAEQLEKQQLAEASQEKQHLEDQLALESESEEEDDEDEDIFDTSYVDVVASGEVKLAYIPESPTLEDDGPDPFDTSIVDQVIKETPEEKRKKKLVSLGCAVDVLTGKVEKPTTLATERPKRNTRRPRQQDLLLGSFDEGGGDANIASAVEVVVEEPQKTLLDDLLDDDELGEEIEVDLSINLAPIVASVTPSPLKELEPSEIGVSPELKSLVSEFEEITTDDNKEQAPEPEDDLDDEFAQLAAESLTKEVHPIELPQALSPTPLNQNEGVKLKPQRPPPPGSVVTENQVKDLDEDDFAGDDPFDTSFAAEVVPGKYELKLIEEEILNHKEEVRSLPTVSIQLPKTGSPLRNPLEFDEHNFLEADQTPLSFKHRDLLGGSTTDLSKIGHSPIEPASAKEGGAKGSNSEELSYCDPFDTSVVNDLVAPGKAELKFLEKELLAEGTPAIPVTCVEEDDDFDPRAEESPPRRKSIPRPEQLFIGGDKRQSLPKVVAFNVTSEEPLEDLLSVGQNETNKASKPLTPYYPEQKLLEDKPSYESESSTVCEDPFDTSFVSSAPGKLELKLIENELVGDISQVPPSTSQQAIPQTSTTSVPISQVSTTLKHSVSDPDFDPRACESQRNSVSQDFLSEGVDAETKLHTPVLPRKIEDDLDVSAYSDPFDTSIAEHILPGKAELKLLESELIK